MRAHPQPQVVLAELDRVVASIIGDALEDAGMRVVIARSSREAFQRVARRSAPSVIIVPAEATAVADACARALSVNGSVRVLSLSTSPRRADLFELRLLGRDVGRNGVVEAVRAAIGISPTASAITLQ